MNVFISSTPVSASRFHYYTRAYIDQYYATMVITDHLLLILSVKNPRQSRHLCPTEYIAIDSICQPEQRNKSVTGCA